MLRTALGSNRAGGRQAGCAGVLSAGSACAVSPPGVTGAGGGCCRVGTTAVRQWQVPPGTGVMVSATGSYISVLVWIEKQSRTVLCPGDFSAGRPQDLTVPLGAAGLGAS